MKYTLGEIKEQKARKIKRIALGLFILVVIGGSIGYIYTKNPEQTQKPTDVAMGTGAQLETIFIGPSELEIKWDEVIGHAWSISLVSGWIVNKSTENKSIEFDSIWYSVQDQNGEVIWQTPDQLFWELGGGELKPGDYHDFSVIPICRREAKSFVVSIEQIPDQVLDKLE
ncbi:MAG: hypothetical protein SVM79_04640 [Chloroflexota bacterium]|nr:hypothetical protein [Chloroflexota bacterium]